MAERIKIFQSTLEVEDEPVTIEKCAKILFLQFKRHRYAYLAIVIDHEGLHQSLIITKLVFNLMGFDLYRA